MSSQNTKEHPSLPTCTDQLLWDTWLSSFHLPTLTVADEVGLFPFLENRSASIDEIAVHFNFSPRAAEAVLTVLASLGYLVQHQGRYSLTESSRNFLLPDGPFYWGGVLSLFKNNPITHADLMKVITEDKSRQGPSTDGDLPNTDPWEQGELPPELAEKFTGLMHSHSFPAAMGIARQGFFNGVNRLLDVAGGSGCFCIAMAHFHPEIQCTILELPPVCALATNYIQRYNLQDRVDTISANMFTDSFPTGYDAVFFANIFHDWNEEQCLQLGAKAFEALPSGGRIFLHEMLLSDGKDGPVPAASFTMAMLKATKGKQFTAGELESILNRCGFVDVSINHSYGYYSLTSAKKP